MQRCFDAIDIATMETKLLAALVGASDQSAAIPFVGDAETTLPDGPTPTLQ
jgi:hypothetical protein